MMSIRWQPTMNMMPPARTPRDSYSFQRSSLPGHEEMRPRIEKTSPSRPERAHSMMKRKPGGSATCS